MGQALGGVGRGGHAEVGEMGPALIVEQDVGRLDVAVDDAPAVRVGEGREQTLGDRQDPVGRHRSVLPDDIGQAASRQVRHDENHVAGVVDDIEERDDGLVFDAGQGVELPLEAGPSQLHLGGRAVQAEALERDEGAVGSAGEIDHAHASPGQAPDDLVLHGFRLRGREPQPPGACAPVAAAREYRRAG